VEERVWPDWWVEGRRGVRLERETLVAREMREPDEGAGEGGIWVVRRERVWRRAR
jgi:hypothetical protein